MEKHHPENEELFFNLASVDESEDGFLAGSQTHLPHMQTHYRSTVGAEEDDEGFDFNKSGRYSTVSSARRSGRSFKKK